MAQTDRQRENSETFSRPTFVVSHTFQSQEAQYVASRCFEGMDRALYFFGGHFLNRGMTAEKMEIIQQNVSERFETFIQESNDEIARIKHLVKERGIVKLPPMEYTAAKKFELRVSNPLSTKFIDLIKKLDAVAHWVDLAWMTGTIQPHQRADRLYHYRNGLRKMTATMRQDQNIVLKGLRADLDAENAAKKARAERKENARAREAVPLESATKKAVGVVRSADLSESPKEPEPTLIEA